MKEKERLLKLWLMGWINGEDTITVENAVIAEKKALEVIKFLKDYDLLKE